MILRPPKKLEWTFDDKQALTAFLEGSTGKLLLSWLAYWDPGFECEEDVNKALGRVKGYHEAVGHLISLTDERPAEAAPDEESNEYPGIDLPEGHPSWKGIDPEEIPVDKPS